MSKTNIIIISVVVGKSSDETFCEMIIIIN